MILPIFKSKVVLNHDKKFPRIFRMAVVGSSGSGKTVFVTQMLLNPGTWDYNQLFIYSKMLSSQPEIENICYAFNKGLSKENIATMFEKGITKEEFKIYTDEVAIKLGKINERIEATCTSDLKQMIDENKFNENKKNLVIFDDFQTDSKVNPLAESLFNNARKKNVSLVYIAQRYSSIPKMIRTNLNFIVAFQQTKRDSDMFFSDVLSQVMDRKDFLKLINNAWAEKYSYIAFNNDTGKIYLNIFKNDDEDNDENRIIETT